MKTYNKPQRMNVIKQTKTNNKIRQARSKTLPIRFGPAFATARKAGRSLQGRGASFSNANAPAGHTPFPAILPRVRKCRDANQVRFGRLFAVRVGAFVS